MSTSKRVLYLVILFFSQAIYFPLNKFQTGGVALKTSLDNLIPIIPAWSIPYLLWMFCWFWLCVWAALKMPEDLFKSFCLSTLIVIFSAMAVFFFYPTIVMRSPYDGNDFGAKILRWIYANDGDYNAFPSGHIYLVTLTAVFYSIWHPKTGLFWVCIVCLVACSTLFTGQHYILDIVGGLAFGMAGSYVGIRILKPGKPERVTAAKVTPPF